MTLLRGLEEAAGAPHWESCCLQRSTERASGPGALGPEGAVSSTSASAPLPVHQGNVSRQSAHSLPSLATTEFENVLFSRNRKK